MTDESLSLPPVRLPTSIETLREWMPELVRIACDRCRQAEAQIPEGAVRTPRTLRSPKLRYVWFLEWQPGSLGIYANKISSERSVLGVDVSHRPEKEAFGQALLDAALQVFGNELETPRDRGSSAPQVPPPPVPIETTELGRAPLPQSPRKRLPGKRLKRYESFVREQVKLYLDLIAKGISVEAAAKRVKGLDRKPGNRQTLERWHSIVGSWDSESTSR